jgi:hypothetical protein
VILGVHHMKENIKMIKKQEKVYSSGQVVIYTRGSTKMMKEMDLEK